MPRVGKLVDLILTAIDKTAEGYIYLEEAYRHPGRVFYPSDYEVSQSSLRVAVSRLRTRGIVEKSVDEGKLILKLTDAGRDWVLKNRQVNDENWDGIWRLVIFDIPESYKNVRNTFRDRLKTWGFIPWQKSVFASKKPLTEELRQLARELKIDDWVLVIESSNVGSE